VFGRRPSLVTAVAQEVIDRAPGAFVRFGIESLGTGDKPALVIGTVVLSLLIGAYAGVLANARRVVGETIFVLFAALGFWATIDAPGSSVFAALTAAVLAAGAAIVSLRALLARAKRDAVVVAPDDEPPAEGAVPRTSRRRFLVLSGGLTAAALLSANLGRLLLNRVNVAAARAKVLLPGPRRPAAPLPAGSRFAVPDLSPLVTPNDEFYRVDTALNVPQVDPDRWKLRVHGRVDRPFELTFAEVLAMPMVEEYVTLACVSNEVGGEYVGNAKWLGVPLATLLERAGVHPGADQIVGRSVDDFTVGFPTAAALDGRTALLAVGMNGEPLPVKHGFPARLVIAGLYGYVSATKWVTELEATTFADYDAYWIPRGWAQQAPIKTESRIDVPRGFATVAAGTVSIAGVAWAQTRGISAVEVQIDNGPWRAATLASAINKDTWRQWRYQWDASPGNHELRVRATDGNGKRQTAAEAPPEPAGATGYHTDVVRVN
jgi:DMSO/TMAO reductase YedYZ molybdopterin-dependent catalytic subunit